MGDSWWWSVRLGGFLGCEHISESLMISRYIRDILKDLGEGV